MEKAYPISEPMKKSAARMALTAALLFIHICTFGQNDVGKRDLYISWDDFMSEYAGDEEAGLDDETIDLLENLYESPININTASRQQLLSLPFLSEEQTDSLLSYRKEKKMFRSLGELMFFKNLDYNDRRYLSLFVYAGDTVTTHDKLSADDFLNGRHELETRIDLPLYRRAGYKTYTRDELIDNPNRIYLGNALASTLRYRYKKGTSVAYGLTFQKDAGEPFANRGNYPYSYTSAYIHIRPRSNKYAVWLGDYDLGLSQGLIFSNSFYSGKLQICESFGKSGLNIRPHTSTDEWKFFRGAAMSFYLRKWSISAFASYRNIGGTLVSDTITSLKTDGLYRTLSEIGKKNNTGAAIGGAYASRSGESWKIGTGGYFSYFEHTVWPKMRAYNRYYFRARNAAGISIDYLLNLKKWKVQGDIALDKNMHYAMVHKVKFIPNGRANLFLQARAFSPRFVSIWGKALQANSRVQNEYGTLLGVKANVASQCELFAYIDYFRFPEPTFRAYAPSQGFETFVQANKAFDRKWQLLVRYSLKSRQQNITGDVGLLEYVTSHKLRLTASSSAGRIGFSTSIDAIAVTNQTDNPSFGGMLSTRAKTSLTRHIDINAFCSIFLTDGYVARLYAYEPQLLYAGSFPTFYDKGTRVVVQARCCIADGLFVAARYGLLYYFNRDSISSGLQEIYSPMKNDISVQVLWRIPSR